MLGNFGQGYHTEIEGTLTSRSQLVVIIYIEDKGQDFHVIRLFFSSIYVCVHRVCVFCREGYAGSML